MSPRENLNSDLFLSVLPVFGMMFLLGVWGLLTICSSQSEAPQPLFFAGKQFFWLLFSVLAMFVCYRIPFEWYRKYFWVISIGFYAVLLMLPVCGVRINSMAGWFRIGNWQFQPSELAKGIFLFDLVWAVGRKRDEFRRLGGAILIGAAWIVPILLEPDMGTAMVYFCGLALVILLGGASWSWLLGCGAAMASAFLAFLVFHPYAWRRFAGFFQPGVDPLGGNWHLRQFEMTVARGEFFGTKLGNAIWSNSYLPLPYNDSALATMMETLGFFGTLPVAVFFLLLVWSLLRLARSWPPDSDRSRYIRCAAYLLAVQALIHAGVNVALIPATGLTLPFISYGGSSLVGSSILLGMALSAGSASHGAES